MAGTRTSRRLASANGDDGSPLKSLPTTTTRRTTKGRRATVEKAPAQDTSANTNDNVLPSREETESRSTSPAPQQQKPLRRSARTVSRSVSPSQKPLPTTKPRQSAVQRKISEPKTAKTRRGKKAAAVAAASSASAAGLPSIIESPVKSPPGAFPVEVVDSPPRASNNTFITSLELTPSHLSTATKRAAADSSNDRSGNSPSNLSLFNSSKRARTDDWSPTQQLLGEAGDAGSHISPVGTTPRTWYGGYFSGKSYHDGYSGSTASPVNNGPSDNNVASYNNDSSMNHVSSTNSQSSDAVVSASSVHSTPTSDHAPAPAPVSHGLFARVKSLIPSFSARASRFQVQNDPVEFTSPTPVVNNNHNNFTSPFARDSVTTTAAPEKATESPLPSITPINAPATAPVSHRYGSLNDPTPDFLKTSKRSGFLYTPKRTMQTNDDDDAGYESDEYRAIIKKAAAARSSPTTRAKDRAAIRKITQDMKDKDAAANGLKRPRQDGLITAMLQPRQPRLPLKESQGRDQASPKSASGSMHISAVKSHSGDATFVASSSATANGISHSAVLDSSSTSTISTTSSSPVFDASTSPLLASTNQVSASVDVVPNGFVLVPANALYLPATANSSAITITNTIIVDTVRAVVAYTESNPQAIPDADKMSSLLGHYKDKLKPQHDKPETHHLEPSTPRSALKGSRSSTQDIHQADRHAKRVAWQMEEDRDSLSLDPPPSQNSHGKRTRADFSADNLDFSDESDNEEPVKRVVPRGDYSADIYDSDASDDSIEEVTDSLSDYQLSQFLTGIVEYDVAFVKFYENRQPQCATRLWRLLKARLRKEDEEKRENEKKQPAFDTLSPISERSESSFVEAGGSTPSLPSGGEVESSPASVAPLRERSGNSASVPATPVRKSYTPAVSSQLRNVTNASSPVSPTPPRPAPPTWSFEDICALVDQAPSPPLCRIPGIFLGSPSPADVVFGPN